MIGQFELNSKLFEQDTYFKSVLRLVEGCKEMNPLAVEIRNQIFVENIR